MDLWPTLMCVVQRRAKSYVTDSPKHLPTPKKFSYSQGMFRNWLEVLLPGIICPKVPIEAIPGTAFASHSEEQPTRSVHKED